MFDFIENLKIKEIIYRYRDFKREYPDFNEDQLCRLTISKRLKDYPHLYNLQNNADKAINSCINDLFKKELNLKSICLWFMEQEYPKYSLLHNSQNLNDCLAKIKNLENRIDHLLIKIQKI